MDLCSIQIAILRSKLFGRSDNEHERERGVRSPCNAGNIPK